MPGRARTPPEKRFGKYFRIVASGCWLWTGATSKARARFWDGQKMVWAYIWSWEHKYGKVPAGKVLDHFKCQNPLCVNPDHVQPVTVRVNNRRGTNPKMVAFARNTCTKGHDLTNPANVYTKNNTPTGRRCRICTLEINKRSHERGKVG